jgi:hypothetical protein
MSSLVDRRLREIAALFAEPAGSSCGSWCATCPKNSVPSEKIVLCATGSRRVSPVDGAAQRRTTPPAHPVD